MIDETVAFIIITFSGVGGSFLSYWMAFNAKGEAFNMSKHGNALITGAIIGLGIGVGNAIVNGANLTIPQFGLIVITTFMTGFGIDRARSSGSAMIFNNPEKSRTSPQPTG